MILTEDVLSLLPADRTDIYKKIWPAGTSKWYAYSRWRSFEGSAH